MITLQGKLKPEDYIKAQYLHMQPSSWLMYLGIALLSFCLVIFVALTSVSVPLTTTFSIFFSVFVPMFILVVFYVLILLFVMPWNVRRTFAQQKTLQVEYQNQKR